MKFARLVLNFIRGLNLKGKTILYILGFVVLVFVLWQIKNLVDSFSDKTQKLSCEETNTCVQKLDRLPKVEGPKTNKPQSHNSEELSKPFSCSVSRCVSLPVNQ